MAVNKTIHLALDGGGTNRRASLSAESSVIYDICPSFHKANACLASVVSVAVNAVADRCPLRTV